MIHGLKTVFFLSALAALFMAIGGLIGGSGGIKIAFVIALFMNAITYFFGDKIVLRMYKAQPLDPTRYRFIVETVQELCKKMQLPVPKLWLVVNPMPNAFATGRSPWHASVALTTGILQLLNPEELKGVLAHELSHIKNRDMLVTTIAATLASALGYVATMAQRHTFYQSVGWGSSRKQERNNWLVILLITLVTPVIATLLQLAISRSREFLADESGASYTGEPLALAGALKRLQDGVADNPLDPNDVQKAATAPLFIVNPFSAGKSIINLFSTHPPLEERIKKLQKMAQSSFIRYS